jgi:hypothetical protein
VATRIKWVSVIYFPTQLFLVRLKQLTLNTPLIPQEATRFWIEAHETGAKLLAAWVEDLMEFK